MHGAKGGNGDFGLLMRLAQLKFCVFRLQKTRGRSICDGCAASASTSWLCHMKEQAGLLADRI